MNEQERISTWKTESRKNQTPIAKGTCPTKNLTGRGSFAKMAAHAARAKMKLPPAIPGACWIPLSKGLFALVDEADYPAVSTNVWAAMVTDRGQHTYAYRNCGKTILLLHRFLMQPAADRQVDHIDGNGLDCRRSNMRVCLPKENYRNVRKSNRTTSSRFKGVTWDKSRCKWKAQIKLNGRGKTIGRFNSDEHAAQAYNQAAINLFGVFAKLNPCE